MKFMFFLMPTIPATIDERRARRPIGNRTEYWQKMLDDVVEIARMAEDLGFDAIGFPERHLHSEGLEVGGLPTLYQHVHKVGPNRLRAAGMESAQTGRPGSAAG